MKTQFRVAQEYENEFYVERYFEEIYTMTLFGIVVRKQDLSQWRKVNKYGRRMLSYGRLGITEKVQEAVRFKTYEEAFNFIADFVEYPIYHNVLTRPEFPKDRL